MKNQVTERPEMTSMTPPHGPQQVLVDHLYGRDVLPPADAFWQLVSDEWYQQRVLDALVRRCAPAGIDAADVRQETLFVLRRMFENNPRLGFDQEKGTVGARIWATTELAGTDQLRPASMDHFWATRWVPACVDGNR